MNSIKFREVSQPKKTPTLLLKALIASPSKDETIPKIGLKSKLGVIEKENAIPFLKVCDYDATSDEIPSVYLHILGQNLQLELMTDEEFPYKLLGTVHISSRIKKYSSIKYGDNLDIEVYFGEKKIHEKGIIISVNQKLYKSGTLVWEEELEFLKKKSNPNSPKEKKEPTIVSPIEGKNEMWDLSSDLGRRYGMISGDINPIHLFAFSAKLFGFKNHIIHGFWTLGRTLATLEEKIEGNSYQLYCDFKLPIFLPNKVRMNYKKDKSKVTFEVRDKENQKPHMVGVIESLN